MSLDPNEPGASSKAPHGRRPSGATKLEADTGHEQLTLAFERLVLEEYSWPCMLVDERGDIVLVTGPATRSLQLPFGALTSNLLEAARGRLRTELKAALETAARTRRRVVRDDIPVASEDAGRRIRVIVRPMPVALPQPSLFIVVVQEHLVSDGATHEASSPLELESTRAELRASMEQLESANERLQSVNRERRQTERELETQRGLLETIIGQLPVGVSLVRGRDLRHQIVNGAYRAIAPGKTMLGKTVSEVWPELHPALSEIYQRILDTGEPYVGIDEPLPIARSPGGPCEPGYFNWALHRVELPGDEGWGILNTVWETTERKRTESALEEANLRLREEGRRKNEFLAMLSHELRNPLTPIRNSLFVLEHAAPGGEQARRATEVIGRQCGQLSRLVDDLLDTTRISRNKVQLQRSPVELNELVRRTIEDHRSLFDAKDITLETAFSAEPLPLNGDAARLMQMVANLLQNAAKFTPAGGQVTVSTAGTEGGRATLRVLDTGVGIEPTMLRQLFQPFMQADATLDRSTGGLGLGLALVKGLVELHGGGVSAHSDGPGKGAEFVVELPLDRAAAPAPPFLASAPAQRRRVLVIEDNVDAATSLREVLEFGEHLVEVAHSGPEGLARAHDFDPEIVLCDIGLPGMDGYEVARTFRADEALKGVFLVALTGYALPEDLQRAANAGFERHLAKPPSPDQLEELLAMAPARPGGIVRPSGSLSAPVRRSPS